MIKQSKGYIIKSIRLPVEYKTSAEKLLEAIKGYEPDIIISFGLAPDNYIRLEEVAKNNVGNYPDNKGYVPTSEAYL